MHISTCEWGSPIYVCVGCNVRFLIYFIRNGWKTNGKLVNHFRSARLLLLLAAKVRKQEKNFSGKVELQFSSRRCFLTKTISLLLFSSNAFHMFCFDIQSLCKFRFRFLMSSSSFLSK